MHQGEFQDCFSAGAEGYARHRLTYPARLYRTLADLAPGRERCWDCATGSGQAAVGLAACFDEVIATDASAEQLARARPHPRVVYREALAERSGLPARSVDLVTVAAAIHWFDHGRFYDEVRRVTRPGAILAAWSYGAHLRVGPTIDPIIERFVERVGPHWPERFRHIRAEYRELPFPFEEITLPPLSITMRWTVDDLVGNMQTWSGVQAMVRATGTDPTAAVRAELSAAWGAAPRRPCEWPLFFRVGRVS